LDIKLVVYIGAFIRWLFKGCKTKLKDEINGNFQPKWAANYDLENTITGLVGIAVIIIVFIIIKFVIPYYLN
jgi:uncharacterized Tic20 family protein